MKKKSIFFFKISYTSDRNKKKTLPQALVEQSITQTKRQKRTSLQNTQENQSQETPHPVEQSQSRFQKSSQKEQEGRLKKKLPALSTAFQFGWR